jgi:outer membrane usher protein
MPVFERVYRAALAMPLLALCAPWSVAAGGETLPRDLTRAHSATWFALHSPAGAPRGSQLVSGVYQTSLSSSYGVGVVSLSARQDAGNPRVTRLDTTWTTAIPGQRDTLRLGDSINQPGIWGREVRFGGLHYGTNLATQPVSVAPLSWPSGASRLIGVGRNLPYTLSGIPQAGPALLPPTSFAAPALMRPGLADRAYAVGFLRSNYGLDGDRYGPLFASATLRRGISDDVTTELRGSAQQGAENGGIAFLARLKGLGVLSAATAASRGDAGFGTLARTGFEHRRGSFGASIQSQWTSPGFRQLGVGEESMPARYWSAARATYDSARHGAFGLGYAVLAQRNQALSESLQGTCRIAVGKATTLTLEFSRTVAPERDTSLMLVFTLPLDLVRTVNAKAGAASGFRMFDRTPTPAILSRSAFWEG